MNSKVRDSEVRYAVMVNVHEAKTHFSRLLEQVHAGQEVILSKAGKPYARMLPLETTAPRRQFGRLAGASIHQGFFDPLPEDELGAWDTAQ